jgi:4-oxalocrotonate tautomerase
VRKRTFGGRSLRRTGTLNDAAQYHLGVPLIEVTLVEGRTAQQLRDFMHQVHLAAVATLAASPASVRVIIREIPATHWAAGDETLAERRATAAEEA